MLSSDLRLLLIDQATDRLGDPLSKAALALFLRHLRRPDLDHSQWHRCDELAASGACTHHQARAAAGQLVRCGLLERQSFGHLTRGSDRRYTAYRLVLPAPRQEGAAL
ncbi:hypothetical protein HCJ76_44265 [Streptomyces sp. MC1]|uniref:hypothetical protein n=1 Tax=Streptomyces sp. MC1 TaxID=295105 RepID=UPI0018C8D884|nr:hypothetical protein [Streptomyces sp. MC1]MBG7704900.1 hypothetical protein [Streptomyces sp. MC1]